MESVEGEAEDERRRKDKKNEKDESKKDKAKKEDNDVAECGKGKDDEEEEEEFDASKIPRFLTALQKDKSKNGKTEGEDEERGHTFRRRRLTYTKLRIESSTAAAAAAVRAMLGGSDSEDSDNEDGGQKRSSTDDEYDTDVDVSAEEERPAKRLKTLEESDAIEATKQTMAPMGGGRRVQRLRSITLHAGAPPRPRSSSKSYSNRLYQPSQKHHPDNDEDDDTSENGAQRTPSWKRRRSNGTELPFPRHLVGTYSCHGVEPLYDSDNDQYPDDDDQPNNANKTTTIAKINQDRGGVAFPYGNSRRSALFAAYDGHGDGGELVSQFALHEIQHRLEVHPDFHSNIVKAFKDTFLSVDNALIDEPDIEPLYSGSTACVVLMRDRHLSISNVGDSRAVLARRTTPKPPQDVATNLVKNNNNDSASRLCPLQAIDLSTDQNPDTPGEQRRIEDSGGFVSPPPEEGLSARVWLDANHTQIGLAMARSIGDHAVKSVGVIAEPEVTHFDLTDDDEFMIIATDGVWEFLSSREAVDIVAQYLDQGLGSSMACQRLIEAAAAKWHQYEGDYRDDITALVVRVNELWCGDTNNAKGQ